MVSGTIGFIKLKYKPYFLFFVFFLLGLNIVNSVDISGDYTLLNKFTFDDIAISGFTVVEQTGCSGTTNGWNIVSGGVSGNRLEYNCPAATGGKLGYAYLNNGTAATIINPRANSYIIRGWHREDVDDTELSIFGFSMYYNATNTFSYPYSYADNEGTGYLSSGTRYFNNSVTEVNTNTYYNAPTYITHNASYYDWQYLVINITANVSITWNLYNREDMNELKWSVTYLQLPRDLNYNQGFQGYRESSFDEIEVWKLGVAVAPPANATTSLSLNTNIVNSGNYTNNPFTISYNGTINNTQELFNCSLFTNITGITYNASLVNITKNNLFNVTAYQKEGSYSFNLSCLNVNASNSITRTFNLNTTIPFPIINNIVQYPSNATLLLIAEFGINVTANVTGNLNYSSIFLDLRLNGSEQFLNGTRIYGNLSYLYNDNSSSIFRWFLDENKLLSYTMNLNENLFSNTTHSYITLSSSNQWFKMEFLNVSNNKPQNFYEIYDENATITEATSQYYYCNSSYTNGNPTNNANCVLFFSQSNKAPFNHVHSVNSKHKVLPLGINITNGKIGNVYVTPISYILKRGNNAGDRLYYINITTRLNAMQYSSNNGNAYTSMPYTIDAHIHQSRETDLFYYRIYASNTIGNTTYSSFSSDIIDVPILPPIPINYYAPLFGDIYLNNGSLLINHTTSFSMSNQAIINYTYFYSKYGESDFIYIGYNDYGVTTYNWDLFLISPNYYYLRTYTFDSLNQSSYADSEVFYVQDRITSGSAINLSGVENELKTLSGGVNMIGYIFLFILNMVIVFLLLVGRLDNVYSFFNGIFSLVLMLIFWPLVQIISYLCLLVLITNMMLFFRNTGHSVGRTW